MLDFKGQVGRQIFEVYKKLEGEYPLGMKQFGKNDKFAPPRFKQFFLGIMKKKEVQVFRPVSVNIERGDVG